MGETAKQQETVSKLVEAAMGACKLSTVESLEDYFSQEFGPDGKCRPCEVAPLASLYLTVLEQGEEVEAAAALSEAYETGEVLTIAKTMDNIKAGATDGIREALERLDCFVQSYEPNSEEEAGAETVQTGNANLLE